MTHRDSDNISHFSLPTSHSHGVLVVDKPADISSAGVVARVKKLLGVRKVGHAGTLDPFATGVLVCCLGQGTRLARFFLHDRKTYEAILRLGVETDTQDATGTVVSECGDTDFSEDEIREAFGRFRGEIEQQPPAYSALKHEGVPLYKLARRGEAIRKPPRQVSISRLDILDIRLPGIRFQVACSGGTYIRTLAADIGTALGCGAHLTSLRRLESSGFHIKEAVILSELEEKISRKEDIGIIGMADALRGMPRHVADDALEKKIRHGVPLTDKDIPPEADLSGEVFKITDPENRLLAVLTRGEETGKYKYCCVFHRQNA